MTRSREFPGILRRLRVRRGLTQEQLAKLAGVPKGAISLWELGKAKPDSDQLVGLSRALRVSADELLGLTPLTGDAALGANVNLPKVCDQLRAILATLEQALAEPRDAAKRRPRKS
ncbi:MAG: helix-turn-helix domain-containing protein [Phycisphaerales bacterium]|nr:MAG: helix-turn-helix domain-containing protein [Phycisphaerales bacterium]